jgi:ABC-type siderophore export system fused ATPase/permease subunit
MNTFNNIQIEKENTIIKENIKDTTDIYSSDDQKTRYKLEQIDYFKNINFYLFYIYLLLFIGLIFLFIITKNTNSTYFRIGIVCIFLIMLIIPINEYIYSYILSYNTKPQ